MAHRLLQAKVEAAVYDPTRRHWRIALFNEDGTPYAPGSGGGGGGSVTTVVRKTAGPLSGWSPVAYTCVGGRQIWTVKGSGFNTSGVGAVIGARLRLGVDGGAVADATDSERGGTIDALLWMAQNNYYIPLVDGVGVTEFPAGTDLDVTLAAVGVLSTDAFTPFTILVTEEA